MGIFTSQYDGVTYYFVDNEFYFAGDKPYNNIYEEDVYKRQAQAYCDLALPAYTSDIIDVGIQDHGIEHILPKEITSEDYPVSYTHLK